MSNTERQRQFRKRNPGYYGRLHARQRAEIKARLEARKREAVYAQVVKKVPLMLPAPVETIEIPGMNTIEAIGTLRASISLRVSDHATLPSSSAKPLAA